MAIKRLKVAETHLKAQDKESFYEEVLRAIWGYFSDKLSIPVARLSKDNIEAELAGQGIDDALVEKFMTILDTCGVCTVNAGGKYGRNGPEIYNETLGAIGEMENKLKEK